MDDFLVGNSVTLADFSVYPCIAYMVHRGLELHPKRFPKIIAFMKRMEELPFVKLGRPSGWEEHGANLFSRLDKIDEKKKKKNENSNN